MKMPYEAQVSNICTVSPKVKMQKSFAFLRNHIK